MDSLRGAFDGWSGNEPDDEAEDEIGIDVPPPAIGQDERRMQVRAYNHWASLLGDRPFPLIADLETGTMPDFDPWAVLLDFATGVENPTVRYLGSKLAAECDSDPADIRTLSDVPGRSLLSRITDHYMQILANQAPIGFEAEFVNQRGRTILYRGILLPFSGNLGSTGIDLIYGVINWKELADQQTTDELLQAIDRALEAKPKPRPEPLTAWADGPADPFAEDILTLDGAFEFPVDGDPVGEGLADLLASARELADAAQGAEDRTRQALYAAIGRAHDFALAALEQPAELAEILADAGLTVQDRAPLVPLVKLVFGADYDKTRLTEYATAIAHARRIGLGRGALAAHLGETPGGLKGVVQAERRAKQGEAGRADRLPPRERVAARLRSLPTRPLSELGAGGQEFTLVLARRTDAGEVVLVGELDDDLAMLERAARKLGG